MKLIKAVDVANELNLEVNIIESNLTNVILEEKEKTPQNFSIYNPNKKEAYVFEETDIEIITASKENESSLLQLASRFNLDSNTLIWLLEEMIKQEKIEQETLEYLKEVKDKPGIRIYCEPEAIELGEEINLVVDITTETRIQNPKIEYNKSPDADIIYTPTLPEEIHPGRTQYKYIREPIKYGKHPIEATFTGIIEGNLYEDTIQGEDAIIKSLPPELNVEKIPRKREIFGEYNKDIELVFRITNRGKGEALNIKIDDVPTNLRTISGENIGRIGVKARIDHPVTLRPLKSGEIPVESLKISYKDGDDKKYQYNIDPITIKVTTPKPELKIETTSTRSVNSGEIFNIEVRITNIGKGPALNLKFRSEIDPKSSGIEAPTENKRQKLKPGYSTKINYTLRAPEKGNININFSKITYFDEEGNKITDTTPPINIKVHEMTTHRTKQRDWPFEIGTRIDKYRLKKELGQGGFSIVYLSEDTMMNTNRAIKALKAEYVEDKAMVEDFINEAKNSQKLFSENIIQVFDVSRTHFKNKDYPYIVMEAITGGTLRDKMIRGEAMDTVEACMCARDICDALLVAHQRSIIHQDIKPSNIFYDEKMVLWKLGDFGLAKIVEESEIISKDGTTSYMAPEPNKTYKSDIYSLGLVMREMLTGTRKGNLNEVYSKTGLNEERTEKLVTTIERMTHMDPDKRPELREVIEVLDLSTVRR